VRDLVQSDALFGVFVCPLFFVFCGVVHQSTLGGVKTILLPVHYYLKPRILFQDVFYCECITCYVYVAPCVV
jgi:hypothetical protein